MSGLVSDFNSLNKTSSGKPYLKEGPEFNISHSGQYVICAISDNGETGIDIEEIQYHADLKEFKSFFNLSEWSEINGSRNFANTFFEYWTKKEAVMKASGKGFSLHPSDIFINGNTARAEGKTWNLTAIQIDEGYACQLATENHEKIMAQFIPVSQLT
jgi:4'-phosphopantetheinyl transferase